MTSSSYCELTLRQDGNTVLSQAVQSWEIPEEVSTSPRLPANRPVELTLGRGKSRSLMRVRLESDELLRLPVGRQEWTVQMGEVLRDQYGLAELVVEEAPGEGPTDWSPVLSITLSIEADPNFRRLHEALVEELEAVHLDLARDVVSRTWMRRRTAPDVRALSAEADLQKMIELSGRLERNLQRIGEQPSRALHRRRVFSHWRPGDSIGAATLQRLAQHGAVRQDGWGRPVFPGKVLVERPSLATDIEEHRHIRSGILRLAERSASLSRYCLRAIHLLEEDEGRWSEEALRQKIGAKIEGLERIREQAHDLQIKLRRMVRRVAFLADASPPRTAFGPTPLFLGRPAYREVYRTLVEARRYVGGRVDADAIRVRFRNLATLYEYWLFVKVVGLLREMYGAPVGNRAFSLIDEVYRPELAPGQQFRFRLPQGDILTATYEPDYPPTTARCPERYRASFASGTLRPDVTIELSRPGHPPYALALDAKSGPRFHKAPERLQGSAQYLWQIHDPASGHQPIRHLFLVHRDLEASPVCNVSGYLEGRVTPPDARILGAIPSQPGDVEQLRNVILRFLETFRSRRWR